MRNRKVLLAAGVCLALLGCRGGGSDGRGAVEGRSQAELATGEGSRCTRNSDCVLTHVPEGSCCPTLCEPRATSASAVRRGAGACAGRSRDTCAVPMCRPLRGVPQAVCEAGTCRVQWEPGA